MDRGLCSVCVTRCIVVVAGACDDWFEDDDDNGKKNIGKDFVAHLDTPCELQFASNGRLFVTQRPGSIIIIESDGDVIPWLKLDSVVEEVGESGLFGLARDPEFSSNGYFYFPYTYTAQMSPLRLVNKIVRYKNDNGTPVFDKVLLDNIPGNHLYNRGSA